MFNYDQNVHLTHIHQREQINEAERSRLAAEAKPTTHIYRSSLCICGSQVWSIGAGIQGAFGERGNVTDLYTRTLGSTVEYT